MDQYYILSADADDDGQSHCLYRYGNFCYSGVLDLTLPSSASSLPKLLQSVQDAQGTLPFLAEYESVDPDSAEGEEFVAMHQALAFIKDEIVGSEQVLADALQTEAWIDTNSPTLYFEFETQPHETAPVSAG